MKLDFTTLAPFTPPPSPSKSRKRPLITTVLSDSLDLFGLTRGQSLAIETDIAPDNGQLVCFRVGGAYHIGVWFEGAALTVGGAYRGGAFELVGVARPLEPFIKSGRTGRQ